MYKLLAHPLQVPRCNVLRGTFKCLSLFRQANRRLSLLSMSLQSSAPPSDTKFKYVRKNEN